MHKIKVFLYLTLLLSMSSCFEIIEEISLKKDGSGTFQYTINLSQSKSKLASIMLLDSINGKKVPDKQFIQGKLQELKSVMAEIPGISNFDTSADFGEFIFVFKGNFKDIASVNGLIEEMLTWNKKNTLKKEDIMELTFDGNTLIRKQHVSLSPMYDKMGEQEKQIFKGANFRSIQRFEQTVEQVSNPLTKISKSKKAIMTKIEVEKLISGNASIDNTIILK